MCAINSSIHCRHATLSPLLGDNQVVAPKSSAKVVSSIQSGQQDDATQPVIFVADGVDTTQRQILEPRRSIRRKQTAHNHTRLYVVHQYHDRALEDSDSDQGSGTNTLFRIPNALFPTKLHYVLNDAQLNGWEHIISWATHGRCFAIHNPKEFVLQIMPM